MKILNIILKQNTFVLFFIALFLSLSMRGVFLLEKQFLIDNKNLLLGITIIVGIFNAFLMIIVISRIIKFIFLTFIKIIRPVGHFLQDTILSNDNYEFLEKTIKKSRPKVKKSLKEMNLKQNQYNIFWLAPIAAMLLGLLPMPFGFFILLKLIVSAGALYFAVNFHKQGDNFKVWIFGFVVVLYNPIIPIPLGSKALWIIINIPTIYYFYINRNQLKS